MGRLLTVQEVARRLRLHPITVRRHIRSGRIPATRIGRSVRVKEEDIEPVNPPPKRVVDMTPDELWAHITRPLTHEEEARRQRAFDEMKQLQVPIDINTATLKRVGRRMNEVLYGEKTLEELFDEES